MYKGLKRKGDLGVVSFSRRRRKHTFETNAFVPTPLPIERALSQFGPPSEWLSFH